MDRSRHLDARLPEASSLTKNSVRQNVPESRGRTLAAVEAERAWDALERSLARCPYSLGCVPTDLSSRPALAEDRKAFVDLYTKRFVDGSALKWLKFHTTYCFAMAHNQEELPAPPGEFVEHERAGRFIGRTIGRALETVMARGRCGNMPARRCALDVLMSKIGMPPADDSFIEKSYEEHKKVLSLSRPQQEEDPMIEAERWSARGLVERKLREIIDSVFSGVVFHHRDLVPSSRACFENGFQSGGALAELCTRFNELQSANLRSPCLIAMRWSPHRGQEALYLPDVSDVVDSFQDYVDSLWSSRLTDRLDATPVPILEPLKVRMITKGQAAEYYRCLELQRLMHRALSRHPVFRYIGRPIDVEDFGAAFGGLDRLRPDEFYVSGDYRSATDNLDPRLSEYAWWYLSTKVRIWFEGAYCPLSDTPYKELGMKALTGHSLHYNPVCLGLPKGDPIIEKQHWGQLMGSPMSFPILCLVNAAATLAALDMEFTETSRLRVNGDDVGFVADPVSYAKWKKLTRLCGLEFSLGKNYTSRQFMILNSEYYRPPQKSIQRVDETNLVIDIDDATLEPRVVEEVRTLNVPVPWKHEGFLNQSIMFHTVRKGQDAGQQKDVYWTDIGELAAANVRGIPQSDWPKFTGLFLSAHQSVLSEMPPLANLVFPRCLGGAGLEPALLGKSLEQAALNGRDPVLVEKQRRQAAWLACDDLKRTKMVHSPVSETGEIVEMFKDLREMVDSQVQPWLTTSSPSLFVGQKPTLEGATLLGLAVERIITPPDTDEGVSCPGLREVMRLSTHKVLARDLRCKYERWTKNGLAHSLAPMGFETISQYTDPSRLVSVLDCLHEHVSPRSMDRLEPPVSEYFQ